MARPWHIKARCGSDPYAHLIDTVRRRVTAAALVMVLSACGSVGPMELVGDEAAADALASRTRVTWEQAEVWSYESDGCTWTSLHLGVHDATWQSGKQPQRSSHLDLWINQYDVCTYAYTGWSAWGEIEPAAFRMSGNLGGARLSTTVEGYDFMTGGPIEIVIDLVWTGGDSSQTHKSSSDQTWWGTRYRERTTTSTRNASVTGTITSGPASLALAGADGALSRGTGTWMTQEVKKPTAPQIVDFAAWPSTINAGQPAYLSWWVHGSDPLTLSIDQGIGDVSGTAYAMVYPTETTTYTLTATNRRGSTTAQTTVTVVVPPLPDGYDNHDRENALDVAFPFEGSMVILPGEVDWFAFELTEATKVMIEAEAHWPWAADLMLGLFDEWGSQLGFNDDWSGFNPRIAANLGSGRYLVAVTGFYDGAFEGAHGQSGGYTVRIDITPPTQPDHYEPNDTVATAFEVPLDFWGDLTLTQADVDWFAVTVPAWSGGLYLYFWSPEVDAMVVIADSAGGILSGHHVPQGSYAYIDQALAPGSYLVGVTGISDEWLTGDHEQDGGYSLGIYLQH
jgi:predicted small lipoprotein YifL